MTILDSNTIPSGGNSVTTTSIVNGFSAAGVTPGAMSSASNRGTKQALSGALTSGVLKSMLSVSGAAGSMSVCALHTNDGTAQTLRLRVLVDGAYTAFDTTSASVSAANLGIIAAGTTDSTAASNLFDGQVINWKTSIDVSIASSASATDKLVFVSKYMLEA